MKVRDAMTADVAMTRPDETLREAARSGIDGFIMKPFRARHITEAVSKVIPGLTSAGDAS